MLVQVRAGAMISTVKDNWRSPLKESPSADALHLVDATVENLVRSS
jgi:hypothetical protein